MLKKIAAFVASLVLSVTFAVSAFVVSAADDWHEYVYTSSTFTAKAYDGLTTLTSSNGQTTMRVNAGGFAGVYKYLDVIPYSYNSSTGKYVELSSYTGSIQGTAQSMAVSINAAATNVSYICSVGIVCNTTDSHAGTYKTILSHIRKSTSVPIPDPWITYNN